MIFVLVYFRALKRKPFICKSDNAFRFSLRSVLQKTRLIFSSINGPNISINKKYGVSLFLFVVVLDKMQYMYLEIEVEVEMSGSN